MTELSKIVITEIKPIPCSTKMLARSSIIAGGSSQKLTLFSRGKAITFVIALKGFVASRQRSDYIIIL